MNNQTKKRLWMLFSSILQKNVSDGKKISTFKPRYFYGSEIDYDGNMWHWVSENGKNWVKKRLPPNLPNFQHRFRTPKDSTEPELHMFNPLAHLNAGGI